MDRTSDNYLLGQDMEYHRISAKVFISGALKCLDLTWEILWEVTCTLVVESSVQAPFSYSPPP
jgi:hypothetical protein